LSALRCGYASIGSTSSTCTMRSPRPAAGKLSASDRCSTTWYGRSNGCGSRARRVSLGSPQSAITPALYQVIDARAFDSAQVVYNMLNPSAAVGLPANYPAQDYGRLFDHTRAAGVGIVGIRVLAGGALSGSAERHPIASPPPEPIGSATSYDADVARARRLMPLVKEEFVKSLTEAATRFALSHPAMGTILVGMATPQQFEDALAAIQKGPLPPAVLDRLTALQQTFAGEPR
jgi:aryl-alcohol dehydrogenase-like predicted oxidoreductase